MPLCRINVGPHQVEHAAQHGQQQEGSLGAHIVDGAHYSRTGGRHAEDERPDGVQVKLRRHTHTGVIYTLHAYLCDISNQSSYINIVPQEFFFFI